MFTGFYSYGRPGTSKTHTVLSTLDKLAVNYKYHRGHLTPMGLFDLLDANRDRIIVLDDLASLFNEPIALHLLLAALGNTHTPSGPRDVMYKTAKGEQVVPFTGGIIAISNLPLSGHHTEILGALNDRAMVMEFDPCDEQIVALIMDIAGRGVKDVPPAASLMVATYLVEECRKRGIRPTVRMFLDEAIQNYRVHDNGDSENDWRDLVSAMVAQQAVKPEHPKTDVSGREQAEAELRIALRIWQSYPARAERVAEWRRLTTKSQAGFYRRVKDLKESGQIPTSRGAVLAG